MRPPTALAPALRPLAGQRALVVASTGGHLAQAVRWARLLHLSPSSHFVTFESAQSHSLLQSYQRTYVPYVSPRDWRGVVHTARLLRPLANDVQPDFVLSTGAGVGISCLFPHLLQRIPFYYLESISRFDGPSLTGRVLARVPTVRRGTQHPGWASLRWPYVGNLLDAYQFVPKEFPRERSLTIFVSLGTIRPYGFDRLVQVLTKLLKPGDKVIWQMGVTAGHYLPGTVVEFMSANDYASAASSADIVVTHAGVGAILDLLELGISPVVVPRRQKYGEHVDDHQLQAARAFHDRGLVRAVEVEELAREHLLPRGSIKLSNPRVES